MKIEVIRCKNCRYYDPRNLWCFKFLEYMSGDDFCGMIFEVKAKYWSN